MFYFRGQLLHHISIAVNVGIVNVQSLSCLALKPWKITVFLWLAGIPLFLYFLSYGLIQLYFLTSGRKHIMIFKGTAVILCCIGWLLKILLTGRKVISVKGKKLSAWGLFQLLFCTASRKKIPLFGLIKERIHYEREMSVSCQKYWMTGESNERILLQPKVNTTNTGIYCIFPALMLSIWLNSPFYLV